MHTLNDIMGKAPAADNTNGATKTDVANGNTFWGLTSGQWGLQTGTATLGTYSAGVPKTGQTTKHADGDDGDWEKGVAWPSPRFTDNGDGTVTDNWLNSQGFSGVQLYDYWSSTTVASSTSSARYVPLDGGHVYPGSKTYPLCVWPVRGG